MAREITEEGKLLASWVFFPPLPLLKEDTSVRKEIERQKLLKKKKAAKPKIIEEFKAVTVNYLERWTLTV